MKIGHINKFKVERKTNLGYILKDQDIEVFLHQNDCGGREPEIGSEVSAFVYFDHQGRVAATLDKPLITTVDCDFVKVVDVMPYGVFVDIGIRKDILLSADDLPLNKALWPKPGDEVYAYLKLQKKRALLIDLATREDFLDIKVPADPSVFGQKLNVRVIKIGAEGVNVISTEGYLGFIHHTEYREEPRLGALIEARVTYVRPDGEINLSLLPRKEMAMVEDQETIYQFLKQNDGVLPICDKSSPEEINALLNMSKASFKRALGGLLKKRLVKQDLENKCIVLIEEDIKGNE